jgi:hypothetical protein
MKYPRQIKYVIWPYIVTSCYGFRMYKKVQKQNRDRDNNERVSG